MSYYYPQAAVELQILPEDFKLTSDASLQKLQRIQVQAKNISVTKADYRTTDTFSMDIDYKNFPFDPRTIRSCGVVIYLQDMMGMGEGSTIRPGEATWLTKDTNNETPNIIFQGYVDEE